MVERLRRIERRRAMILFIVVLISMLDDFGRPPRRPRPDGCTACGRNKAQRSGEGLALAPGRGRRMLSQSNRHTAKALPHTGGCPNLRVPFCVVLPPRTDREMRARPLAETEAPERPFGRAEGWLGETDRSALGRRERGGVRHGVEVGTAGRNLGTRSRASAGFAQTQRPAAVSHKPLSRYLGSRSGPASA